MDTVSSVALLAKIACSQNDDEAFVFKSDNSGRRIFFIKHIKSITK